MKEQSGLAEQLAVLEAKAQDLRLWKIRGWRGGAGVSISEPSSILFTRFDLCEKCIEEMPLGKVLRRVAERKPQPTAGDPIPSWGGFPERSSLVGMSKGDVERLVSLGLSHPQEGVFVRPNSPAPPKGSGVNYNYAEADTHGGKHHGVDVLSPGLGEVEIEEPRPEIKIKTVEITKDGETHFKTEPEPS